MADLGKGPGGRGPPTYFEEEMTEGRKAGWASKIEPRPLLSSKSGSATDAGVSKSSEDHNVCVQLFAVGLEGSVLVIYLTIRD